MSVGFLRAVPRLTPLRRIIPAKLFHHRLRAEDDQPRPRVVGGLAEGLLQVLLCGGAPLVRDARRPIQHEHCADAAQRPNPLPPRQRQHNQQHQREAQRQNHPPTRPTDPQQTPTRPPDPAPRHRQQQQIPRLGETHGIVVIPDVWRRNSANKNLV